MSSIKDVARVAGVGVTTAARVLRGEGYASAEARARVKRAALEVHYVPNSLARSMRGGPTCTIGFLVYDLLNPFFAALAAGVEEEAYQQGFTVIMCSTRPWRDPAREKGYLQMLLEKRVDGLIIQHKFASDDSIALLRRQGIPAVRLVSPQSGFPCDLVRCDTEEAAYGLVMHLAAMGRRRIAALGPRLPSTLGEERLSGYRRGLAASGLDAGGDLARLRGWRTRDGYEAALEALEASHPDAFFALGPRIAVGATYALRERGYAIPQDVALVSIDDFGMASDLDPFVTVARQPEVEMGRRATQLLLERIRGAHTGGAREVVYPAEIVIRRSSGGDVQAMPGASRTWDDDEG